MLVLSFTEEAYWDIKILSITSQLSANKLVHDVISNLSCDNLQKAN